MITGDIFDFDPAYIEEGCRELAALDAPLGVVAVLGNHDVYTGVEAVAKALAEWTRIRVLRDEWMTVELAGAALAIAGVEDPGRGWSERDSTHDALARLAGELPRELPRLLLVHRPSYFAEAAQLGFPLALAGHTHGGQIALPAPGQHHNVSRLISRWTRGLFRDEATGALLYVNRGLGVAGPPGPAQLHARDLAAPADRGAAQGQRRAQREGVAAALDLTVVAARPSEGPPRDIGPRPLSAQRGRRCRSRAQRGAPSESTVPGAARTRGRRSR